MIINMHAGRYTCMLIYILQLKRFLFSQCITLFPGLPHFYRIQRKTGKKVFHPSSTPVYYCGCKGKVKTGEVYRNEAIHVDVANMKVLLV